MPLDPIDAGLNCIERAAELLDASNTLGFSLGVRADMRRSALALGIAGVDTYVHSAVLRRISDARGAASLPSELRKFGVPFGDFAALADATVRARNQDPPIATRPWVKVKNTMHRLLLEQTFQGPREIERAMELIGVARIWTTTAAELTPTQTAKQVRDRLGAIVQRRNQIVHEGDLRRAVRPHQVRLIPIERDAVRSDLDWLRELLVGFDAVVSRDGAA